jgi:hypothetical protein
MGGRGRQEAGKTSLGPGHLLLQLLDHLDDLFPLLLVLDGCLDLEKEPELVLRGTVAGEGGGEGQQINWRS